MAGEVSQVKCGVGDDSSGGDEKVVMNRDDMGDDGDGSSGGDGIMVVNSDDMGVGDEKVVMDSDDMGVGDEKVVMDSEDIGDDGENMVNNGGGDDKMVLSGEDINNEGDTNIKSDGGGGDDGENMKNSGDDDGDECVVLSVKDDVVKTLLRRKDSNLEDQTEPSDPPDPPRKKKNSFIKISLEEEEEENVEKNEEVAIKQKNNDAADVDDDVSECPMCPGCPDGSSPGKADRGYISKGPQGRGGGTNITKAYSIEGSAPPVPPHHLPHAHHHHHLHNGTQYVRRSQLQQAVSQGSGVGLGGRRGAPRGSTADDSANRNSRWRGSGAPGTVEGYEMSQDFTDMRLEMLERRYGGMVARRAAVTIQRAYRRYAMYKKFRSITATAKAQEKRLSRRFTVDMPEWGDGPSNQQFHDACNEFDQLQRNISATVYSEGRRPARSMSMRDTPRTAPSTTNTTNTTTATTTTTTRHHQDNYDLNDALATLTLSDTSLYCHVSALSPLTPTSAHTSTNTHVRNGSGDYQGHQNDRELKYFSEDSGLGSQEGVGGNRLGVAGRRSTKSTSGKKVPPEVPRRTSSIKSCSESSGSAESVGASHAEQCHPLSLTPPSSTPSSLTSEGGHSDRGALSRSADNGSLSSVQSSGSDSSLSQSTSDRATPLSTHDQPDNADYMSTSPVWKRKTPVPEVVRKRQYRVGLNLFNKKPEKGVTYLINRGFLENSPQAVSKFLLTRKGLSKEMIGEYLGNLQNNFNMNVLECFAHDIDLSGMQVDVALRRFQTHYCLRGEAQKIERLMQVFAHRYCQCNRDIVAKLRDPETIFILAFAIMMLNTDLHSASMKQEKRMKLEEFIKNLRGIDDGYDIEREMLEGIYQRIKTQEFRPGHDHVTQVLKVEQTMVGKKPNLALPHRRLVCYCRLYEIPDVTKKERVGVHQREVFLFNDLLVVTKIFSKKKNTVTYTFRQSFPLHGLAVITREVAHYPFLMELRHRVDNKILITFNARNEHDRTKFCEDLKESICEMDEMESLRIDGELERQKASLRASRPNATTENRDSGVADMELLGANEKNGTLKADNSLKRSALSNSLLDIHEAVH